MFKLITILLTAFLTVAYGQLVYKSNEHFKKTYIWHGYNQQFNYTVTLEKCRSLNATIVEPRSIGEARWLAVNFNLDQWFWIGMLMERQRVPRFWMDGSNITEFFWKDNYSRPITDRCIAAAAEGLSGLWDISSCNNILYAICEKKNMVTSGSCDGLKQQVETLTKRNKILTETIRRLAGHNNEL